MKNVYQQLKSSTKNSLLIGILLLSLCADKTFAQNLPTVNITVNIIPPYSPYYSDYAGQNASKVLLLVQNLSATAKTIKLTGQLEGDNGIKITTKSNYVPLQPIILNPNETKQLNGLALKDIFDVNSLNVYGIDKSRIIYTSRLPEGNYTFCIQAVDMATNKVISATSPLGCTFITISYPDAPILISPAANVTSTATFPQSMVFNWINAGFAPIGTQYILQIAEMPSIPADPNQVLNAVTFPLINKTVSGFVYVLSPADPPLKVGKRYAWRVKAIDPTGKTVYKNNGVSGANQFRYGDEILVQSILKLNKPMANVAVNKIDTLSFNWSFKDNSALNDKVGFGGVYKPNNFNDKKYELYIIKVKTDTELLAEKKAKISKLKGIASDIDKGIIIPTNAETVDFKTSVAMANYLKKGNNYEWYVKHTATGTVSATRVFTYKDNTEITDYTVTLNGKIKYNFYNNVISAMGKAGAAYFTGKPAQYTEAEKGFDLENKSLQVLRVQLLAKMITQKDSVQTIENGKKIMRYKVTKVPQVLSNLAQYPTKTDNIIVNNPTTIAFGTTDSLGNFKVTVPINAAKFKLVDSVAYTKGLQTYALVEGLVIKITDARYTDPMWFVAPNANTPNVILNEETVSINSYKVNVNFITKAQRDYKGKLYLLKNKNKLIKGEVDNLKGQSKTVSIISQIAGIDVVKEQDRTMVGILPIDFKSNMGNQKFSFDNLVTNNNAGDKYTLYFEPDANQNSLYFPLENVSLNIPTKTGYTPIRYDAQNLETDVTLGPKFLSMRISGRYVYQWKDKGNATINPKLPLPEGTNLVLMKGYISQKSLLKDGSVLNAEKIVAKTTVGKNGAYNFDLGILDYDKFNEDGKQLIIIVDNPYYFSEPKSITYNQQEDVQLPDLLATVKQFKLNAKVGYKVIKGENEDDIVQGVKGLNVYLCRKKGAEYPVGAPDTDGDLQHKTYFKTTWEQAPNNAPYEILDKTSTDFYGNVSFTRLIMPTLQDQGFEYFIMAEPTSDSQYNYITEEPYPLTGMVRLFNVFGIINASKNYLSDNQTIETFNYNTKAVFVPVKPQRPYIDGAVYPYSNTSTSVLSGVNIELYDMAGVDYTGEGFWSKLGYITKLKNKTPERSMINGANGRFLFDDFSFGFFSGWKLLKLSKKGFISTYFPVNTGKPLKKGDRENRGKLYLDLPLQVQANIVNAAGEAVAARVIVGDDFSWADTKLEGGTYVASKQTFVGGKETAYLTSPSGTVNLTIIPNNKALYKTTVVSVNVLANNSSLGNLIVKQNTHSVAVTCINTVTGKSIAANVYLKQKYDKAEQTQIPLWGGKVTVLNFVAAGSQFDLKVIPEGNFTIAKTQIVSDMSATVYTTVYVSPAGTIKATAAVVDNGKQTPTSTFGVAVANYDDDEYIVKKSPNGYMITRLPFNNANSWASMVTVVTGSKSGFTGESKGVLVADETTSNVAFKFSKLPADVPENLYNFPIAITSLTKANNGNYKITGRLNPAGNAEKSNLSPADNSNWLTFYNVELKPSNNGGTASIISEVAFHENELPAILHQNYAVKITDEQGLKLVPDGVGGNISGYVLLDPASLAKGLSASNADNEGNDYFLYLNKQASGYAKTKINNQKTFPDYMRTFSTATSDVFNAPLLVSNASRKKISFQYVDDLLIYPDEDVLLNSKGVKFKGTVSTDLANINNSKNNINAEATFFITDAGLYSFGEKSFNLPLNQWQLEVADWELDNQGLKVKKGVLNALGLTIPFKNLPISYAKLGYGDFDVTKLKLLNAFDVTLSPGDIMTSFGFDKGYSKNKGAWSVSILANSSSGSLASLKGLPDLAANDEIKINNINLYDTGDPADTRILLTQNQPAVTLNQIAKFSPGTVSGGLDFVSFKGALDLEVPNLAGLKTESYELVYKVIDGKFQHDTTSVFKNLTLDANGITIKFNDKGQQFSNNKLVLKGVLTDKDKPGSYNINIELVKSIGGTKITVPQISGKGPKVFMGGSNTTYLDNVEGLMKVSSKKWNNFTFAGDLVTPDGTDPKNSRLQFIVKGDLVADNSKIGVNNMGAGGVSGLSLTYDFKEKALVGSCHIEQEVDFADIIADVEMYIGGSKWYIFSNGVANNIKSSPISQAALGMMVGNATLSSEQLNSLHTHFKSEVPPSFDKNFKSVKGVLFIVSIDVPIPILPTFDIDLDPVAHCYLKHGIYGNFYFNAGFSTKKEDLSMAIGGRLGGYVKVGAGASIGLACASIALGADIHADVAGKLAPWNTKGEPKIQLDLGVTFTLTGEAYVGAGICNSSCETPCVDVGFTEICSPIPCVKVGISKGITVGVSAEMTESSIQLKAGAN